MADIRALFTILAVSCTAAGPAAAGSLLIGLAPGGRTQAVTGFHPAKGVIEHKKVVLGVEQPFAGYAIIDEMKCREEKLGAWSNSAKKIPLHGTVALSTLNAPLSDGNCPGKTFDFAVVSYTWTDTSGTATKDKFSSTYKVTYQNTHYVMPYAFKIALTE